MNKVPYSKSVLSYVDQLQQLKYRGLTIEDDQKALHLLEVISYYRLSGYLYPLLTDKKNHQFKLNATFETAFYNTPQNLDHRLS
jgi:abortive infection bacteriophage resistance protein